MAKMMQIRNVPEQVHAELIRRARKSGKTLTDYVEGILKREVARLPREEVFERVSHRDRVRLERPASEYLAEARREVS